VVDDDKVSTATIGVSTTGDDSSSFGTASTFAFGSCSFWDVSRTGDPAGMKYCNLAG